MTAGSRMYPVVTRRRLRRRPRTPAAVLVTGFAILIAVGTGLLFLPISRAAGEPADLVVAFFTATSAVCVTGLVVVDTATAWSPFGQLVVLGLVQVGGFGFMTGSTLLLLLFVGGRVGLRDRILAQAATGDLDLGGVIDIVRRIALFTILVEATGAAVLFAAFLGEAREVGQAAWYAVFHAISAFNNAGFDLFGGFQSVARYATSPVVLLTLGGLIVLGGLSVAIVADVLARRHWGRLALESKVVLLTTLVLLVAGAVAFAALEWSNPATLGSIPVEHRPLNALFESVTLRSGGFAVINQGRLGEAALFVAMALMFIGGASGSTAGGIKVNTFSVLLIAILSTVRGRPSAEAFGRRVPHELIYRALSVALLSIAFVFVVALGLEVLAGTSFVDTTFEAISAFGTVGLSTGITPEMPPPAQILEAGAMFVGRLGPLTLALALASRQRPVLYRPALESMRIG
ncbi:MAG TPA: potassium transporter TrkG [Candidatus Limnocylindrales bacterium]|nr:potassium transporter TrkG [Candidatus Limnocylindrales bacterium]